MKKSLNALTLNHNLSKQRVPVLYKLPPRINHLAGKAMHDYDMLADGDRVLLAVSGGVDSLILVWLLNHWRQKAPINYELLAVHLDMGFGGGTWEPVEEELRRFPVPFFSEKTDYGRKALLAEQGKSGCFYCARQRRNRLFALAREKGFNKIAFGHHKEDIIETFFLNIFYSGNISTLVPRQDFFNGKLAIIRPMALLEKSHIRSLADGLGITPVANPCPLSEDSKRSDIRRLMNKLFEDDPHIKSNIFRAMSNVKTEYLLRAKQGKG